MNNNINSLQIYMYRYNAVPFIILGDFVAVVPGEMHQQYINQTVICTFIDKPMLHYMTCSELEQLTIECRGSNLPLDDFQTILQEAITSYSLSNTKYKDDVLQIAHTRASMQTQKQHTKL